MVRPPEALDHAAPQLVSPAAAGRLADDLPCKRCGYNLRGLPAASVCPECALPIERSLRGDLLRDSSPAYLRRLVRGLALAFWGAFLLVILPIVGFAVVALGAMVPSLWIPSAVALVIGSIVVALSPLLLVGGWWLAAAPDPGLPQSGEDRVRRLVRWSAVALMPLLVLTIVQIIVKPVGTGILVPIAEMIPLSASALFAVHWFASVFYLVKLADRIPDPSFREERRRLLIGVVVLLVAWFATVVASSPMTPWPLGLVLIPAGIALFIAPLYVAIKYIGLVEDLTKEARRALLVAIALDEPAATDLTCPIRDFR